MRAGACLPLPLLLLLKLPWRGEAASAQLALAVPAAAGAETAALGCAAATAGRISTREYSQGSKSCSDLRAKIVPGGCERYFQISGSHWARLCRQPRGTGVFCTTDGIARNRFLCQPPSPPQPPPPSKRDAARDRSSCHSLCWPAILSGTINRWC